ncbi:MAG: pyruvate synthase, partial [Nitrospinaceae bacterium]|nr:pyruvate synthase [Nitrospinaceae bacterium]NIR55358.1 pyruvate synthase [Nitrospinaceae bacterium]NIS85798.1 pyruvate synthase [Nitrospinaceae bacterium]NIT82650.1 pyruvate synthase [Nitrospinaceae bacterium]NIU44852.1 pyruvate synthase [Nitrospinaceae bacterium]
GVRVFTASSSQGILYGLEALATVAGWRVPLVLVNVSRALATPITLEPDHNDVLSLRDTGILQLHAETCQEVLDYILIAYRLAEDPEVALPVLVNLDGFYLSFTREPVELPDPEEVKKFLPDFKPSQPVFDGSRPMARASAVFGGGNYSYFKFQHHLAALHAETVFNKAAKEFGERFGRMYGPVERFRLEDAEYVFIMSNSFATKGKAAVEQLRREGIKAGLLKLSLIRPFPKETIAEALAHRPKVAVIDQNIAPGMGGILYPEIMKAVYNRPDRPQHLLSVIGGLGGRNISESDFAHIVVRLDQPVSDEPLMLFDENDRKQIEKLRQLAGVVQEA